MRLFVCVLALTLAALSGGAHAADFSNWAAIVVAGDHRAHDGSDSEVFDNGRHDIGAALQRLGFKPANIVEFSTEPSEYRSPAPLRSDTQSIADGLWDLSNRTTGGCLLYLTSHGSPDGIVVDNGMLSPHDLAQMVSNSCGSRPTVVIVSSCFSGIFIPALAAQDRFVMTAARPDRTSFGCGQADRYTFFDQCFLQSIGGAHDFPDLAVETRRCVATREKKDDVSPPSDPQVAEGAGVAAFPTW